MSNSMNLVPHVIKSTSSGERAYDLYSRLMEDRLIFLTGEVNEISANILVGQMLFLHSKEPGVPIDFYINSPGGTITDGLSIYDVMEYIDTPVSTICVGQASSMGSFLLAAGTKGMRYAMPHSRIMVHQPRAGFQGSVSDNERHYEEGLFLKNLMNKLYAHHTGLEIPEIEKLLDRDTFLSPVQAKKLGLIDEITKHELKKKTKS